MAKSCRCQTSKQIFGSEVEQSKKFHLSEIAKNKQKANAGSAREARRRRQMVGERAQNSEKYPLASKLLITEFKL